MNEYQSVAPTSWKEEGRQEGQAELVLRLLKRRWGVVSNPLQDRIASPSVAQLEILGEATLDFHLFSEVEAWLNAH